LIFARDLVTLRMDPTERVSRAYFTPGDYVFRQGDPALNFYAIEKGEAEVVRSGANGAEEVVAVLGAGDYFGGMALLESRSRSAGVRARTALEVTTLGAGLFARLSQAVTPLHSELVQAMRRRTANVALRLPEVHAWLERAPVSTFVEPASPTIVV